MEPNPKTLTPKEVGELIRARRLEMNMTQLDVAKVLGVTKGAVSHWEQGRVEGINPVHLFGLAKLLKLDELDMMQFLFPRNIVGSDLFYNTPEFPMQESEAMRMYGQLPDDVRKLVRNLIAGLYAIHVQPQNQSDLIQHPDARSAAKTEHIKHMAESAFLAERLIQRNRSRTDQENSEAKDRPKKRKPSKNGAH